MFALDTNTVSYFFRGHQSVVRHLSALTPDDIWIPSVVAYELEYGLRRLPAAQGTPRLHALAAFLRPLRILPLDALSASEAARIRVDLEAKGTPIGPHDLLIAALAKANGATLVTHNHSEFSRVAGLKWVDWCVD